jgi:hypothetical protein
MFQYLKNNKQTKCYPSSIVNAIVDGCAMLLTESRTLLCHDEVAIIEL